MKFYTPPEGQAPSIDPVPAMQLAEAAIRRAGAALKAPPERIVDVPAPRSTGGPREFYSEGDYWWPAPDAPGGVPYVKRDGELNPEAFQAHRLMLRRFVGRVGALAVAYRVTGEGRFRSKAEELLQVFLLDPTLGMEPHLKRAQAIPGVCTGRGIGIIDGIHLIDLLPAIESLSLPGPTRAGLETWFASYLDWLTESEAGVRERDEKNNHALAWAVQVAGLGRFLSDRESLALCRELFVDRFLGDQMAVDGSFPRELSRTRPYNYAIFTLDLLVTLAHILSSKELDFWSFELVDGRGVRKGLEYLFPYLAEPSNWPHPRGLGEDRRLPVAAPFMLLASRGGGGRKWLELWKGLPDVPAEPEIRRNIPIKEAYLWL